MRELIELLVGTQESRLADKLEQERVQRETEAVNDILKRVICFPGSKTEFEEFVGYRCVIINTNRSDQGLVWYTGESFVPLSQYDLTLKKSLVDQHIVGIVNAVSQSWNFRGDDNARYGLPVGKFNK